MKAVTARTVAAQALVRVLRDSAFASAALDAELARHPQLDARDRGLATELVYGTLRTLPALQGRLEAHAPRGLGKDLDVRVELLLAAYQILLLDRVPAHAAVNEAVSAVRARRGQRVAGFANAVLRKLGRGPGLTTADAIGQSAPAWLLAALRGSVGEAEALALLGADGEGTPRPSLRLRSTGDAPSWALELPPGKVSPLCRKPTSAMADLRQRPGYAEGRFVIQEEGAQAIGLALGARPGERVLDACAGRGQKTTLLLEQVGADGEVWAVDAYPDKLAQLGAECVRLGLPAPKTAAVDWTLGSGSVPGGFDRVLVDAPCTGVGTLRRRPEIARRLQPEDPARLARLAEAILRRAATHARPGGLIVFAVCSVLRSECEAVVERVSDLLEPVAFPAEAPEVARDVTAFRLLPLAHGTDGYFAASFRLR